LFQHSFNILFHLRFTFVPFAFQLAFQFAFRWLESNLAIDLV
jgi:hypothetical protein